MVAEIRVLDGLLLSSASQLAQNPLLLKSMRVPLPTRQSCLMYHMRTTISDGSLAASGWGQRWVRISYVSTKALHHRTGDPEKWKC